MVYTRGSQTICKIYSINHISENDPCMNYLNTRYLKCLQYYCFVSEKSRFLILNFHQQNTLGII